MKIRNSFLLFMAVVLAAVPACRATQDSAQLTALIGEVTGEVKLRVDPDADQTDAEVGAQLEAGSQITTGPDGRARLDFSDGSLVRIVQNTDFTLEAIEEASGGPLVRAQLLLGQIYIVLRGGSLEVDAPSGTASVRGSFMSVAAAESGELFVTCLEGECQVETAGGGVMLVAGQTAAVTGANEAPVIGLMSDAMVSEWLRVNPEATEVLPALTATVGAGRSGGEEGGGESPAATELPPLTSGTGGNLLELIAEGAVVVEQASVISDSGETYGPILSMTLTNPGAVEVQVTVPCGLVFSPTDSGDSRLMVVQPAAVSVPPGETVEVTLYIECMDLEAQPPEYGARYVITGMVEDENLRILADCLCGESLGAGMDEYEGMGVQFAVWWAANGEETLVLLQEAHNMALSTLGGDAEIVGILDQLIETFSQMGRVWLDRCGVEIE